MMSLDRRMKKWLWPPQGWTWRPLHPNLPTQPPFPHPKQECSPRAGAFQWPLSVAFFSDHVFLSSEFCLECPSGFSPSSEQVTHLCRTFLTPTVPTGSSQATVRHSSLPLQSRVFLQVRVSSSAPRFSPSRRGHLATLPRTVRSQQPAAEPMQTELSPWHHTTLPKRHGGRRN